MSNGTSLPVRMTKVPHISEEAGQALQSGGGSVAASINIRPRFGRFETIIDQVFSGTFYVVIASCHIISVLRMDLSMR
jgi:hypothetical protein